MSLHHSSPQKNISKVDVNCDLGEGSHISDCHKDAKLMPFITRCNIACGEHAGNDDIMQRTLLSAKKLDIIAGAHPGYPDKKNFGRQSLDIPFSELTSSLYQQVSKLIHYASVIDIKLDHIKLHGALYNDVEQSPKLAQKITAFFQENFSSLKLVGLSGGALQSAAQKLKVKFISEGFMDRAYQSNGYLIPRSQPNSVHDNLETIVDQALAIATQKPFKTNSGEFIKLQADTICLHGDRPDARIIARNLFYKLQQLGFTLT